MVGCLTYEIMEEMISDFKNKNMLLKIKCNQRTYDELRQQNIICDVGNRFMVPIEIDNTLNEIEYIYNK